MASELLNCTRCGAALSLDAFNASTLRRCPSLACQALMQIDVFPALFSPPARGQDGEKLLVDDQSSCFYHPEKKAVIHCASCGRFLCALCDIELNDQHLCPTCLETGKKKRKLVNLENHRVQYDGIALSVALLPLLIFYVTCITAPIAIYIAIRYWRAPLSIVRRTRVRFVLAIVFASLQIVGWAFAIAGLMGALS